jgi:hypothetical protein
MPHQNWAKRLEDELARRGVPARYRTRLLTELRDHADDLTDREGLKMSNEALLEERLGEPEVLATQAAEEYRRRRWVSRHPLLVFGLLPIPTLVVACAVLVMAYGLVSYGLLSLFVSDVNDLPRPVTIAFAYTLAWGIRFVPFVLLAIMFSRLYLRNKVNRWWFIVAAFQILLMAGSLVSSIQYSDEPGKSAFSLGFAWAPMPVGDGWELPFMSILGWMQLVQITVPALVGLGMFRLARRRQAMLAIGC